MFLEPLDTTIVGDVETRSLLSAERTEDKRPSWELEVFVFSSMHVPAEKVGTDQTEGCNSRGMTDILERIFGSFLSPKHSSPGESYSHNDIIKQASIRN